MSNASYKCIYFVENLIYAESFKLIPGRIENSKLNCHNTDYSSVKL